MTNRYSISANPFSLMTSIDWISHVDCTGEICEAGLFVDRAIGFARHICTGVLRRYGSVQFFQSHFRDPSIVKGYVLIKYTGVGAACQSNDGKKTPQFTPQFPGTCPYITAVGGTQSINPEIAWVASSGGFSNYFTRPQYQAAAVANYLENEISKDTLTYFTPYFNSNGRGFPDVSAHSLHPEYVLTKPLPPVPPFTHD